jgi:hypothetical protein
MKLTRHLPPTATRVERNTRDTINQDNRARLLSNVRRFEGGDGRAIGDRISELRREWDIERAIETNASIIALVGLLLGAFVHPGWLLLPALVLSFLLQHALQGWCPPIPILRRVGVRTEREINEEILALRILRGDFSSATTAPAAVAQATGEGIRPRKSGGA